MIQSYYVACITREGWRRVSESFKSVTEAHKMHNLLKSQFPRACILAERVVLTSG